MTYESSDSPRGGVRRRTVLGGAAAAAAGLALAGCGDDGDAPRERRKGQKITLTFWSWVPGIDRPVDLWNRTHPEVQVKVEKVSAVNGEQYAKMHAAIKAGNPPDLGQIEFPVIPSFLLDGGLRDLAPLGAARHRDAFFAWQWGQSVFGSGIYAIPQASGPMGLFVRQDLFDRWGIPVPRTWDAYAAAAKEVRRHGAWIETFAPTNGNRFAGLAWQAGAKWYATHGDTWVVHLDDAPTRRVADYWEALVRGKLVKTIPDRRDAWYKDIQTGAIPAWVGASWGDALLAGNAPGTKGRWRAAPLPQWRPGGRAYANWGGSTTAVFAKASYPRDALDFAVWLNTDPGSIALLLQGGYGFPSAKAGYAATALDADKDFFGGQPYSRVFADAGAHVDTSWQWGPGVDTLFQRLGDAFTDALADGSSFRSVLTKVQRQTVSDLRDKGLKAESGR
ncbi:solute-binding lipoprotein [Streptomyces noursei ATCC 11455]|uniref:ABC transporter substrate-binding protein n=1 Tax=Streptomyces noursei TaxID=1971 RepID=UPI00081CA89C|nr:solute-binding lipoprotein [Streptomyces noursei ATCC 11455]